MAQDTDEPTTIQVWHTDGSDALVLSAGLTYSVRVADGGTLEINTSDGRARLFARGYWDKVDVDQPGQSE